MTRTFDFLVVGSGMAGLHYALKVADHGTVGVLCKSDIDETNTRLAQGGIAGVIYNPEDKAQHKIDTLNCGAGICNEKIVDIVVGEAEDRINDLIDLGTQFDKEDDGTYHLVKEGGHSNKRILHYKDATGYEIQRALTQQVLSHPNIEILEHCFALDIITQHHLGEFVDKTSHVECYGAYVHNMKTEETFTALSKITLIATGGIGYIYQNTTNPKNATGDGIAMVYRAKGQIENMEFVQFHPTALYNPKEKPSFLITEAMRGHGAVLRTVSGEEFMHKYDSRKSLAPRDIVARAIDSEMKIAGSDYVFLDCTHLEKEGLKEHFPNIYKKCLDLGIDITKEYIPVTPAAHYVCGGIKVDENGRSTIANLYAAGEVSSTGLHGANRLASNSLLEASVFAHRAAMNSIKYLDSISFAEGIPAWDEEGTSHPEEMILITQNWKEMQQIMSNYVGIVRSDLRLARALSRLEILYKETEALYKKTSVSLDLCELRNAINVAYLILKMAGNREESLGLHYSLDHPAKKD